MQKVNKAVSNKGIQTPQDGIGIDTFEFWTPARTPNNKNIAMNIEPAIAVYSTECLKNSYLRPSSNKLTTAWVADLNDERPELNLTWDRRQLIKQIKLFFDADFDNSLESILMGHPESITNFVVQDYQIFDGNNQLIFEKKRNYQAVNCIDFDKGIITNTIKIIFNKPNKNTPVSLFKIACYSR